MKNTGTCQTCDHDTWRIGETTSRDGVFWCPRCGTVAQNLIATERTPSLVRNITEFAGKMTEEHEGLIDEFEKLGIRESICSSNHIE